MQIRELSIPDAYEVTPRQFADDRGVFLEWYRFDRLEEVRGHALDLRQANTSVSARGVVRGIHFASVPPSQAKYVTCQSGAIVDVVVDIRVGSPTFGRWEAVRLDEEERKALYIAEGLGHAFMALTDRATVSYLCSEVYSPTREHGISPLDPSVGIEWPADIDPRLSPKDEQAPTLQQAAEEELLPTYDACSRYYAALRDGTAAEVAPAST